MLVLDPVIERSKLRVKALEVAQAMRPMPTYNYNMGGMQNLPPYYDLLGEAEKIYQWLIKENG